LEQRAFNQQLITQQAQQNAALKLLEKSTPTVATPTGKGSTFQYYGRASYMNTSRFYPGTQSRAVR
jgi:hypothetical protein